MNVVQELWSKISQRSKFRKIRINILWLFLDRFFKYGASLVIGVWVANYLGPTNYGILSYAIAFSALFGVLSGLGLKNIVIRELVKNPEIENQILGTAISLLFMAGVFTWCVTMFSINYFNKDDFQTVLIVSIISAGFVFQAFKVISFLFEAKVESRYVVLATNISLVISSILKVILILQEKGIIFFALISLLDTVIVAVCLLFLVYKLDIKIFTWRWKGDIAKGLLKDSIPFIFSGLMMIVYMRIDQIMLKEFVNETEVGIYSLAVRMSEAWNFIPMIITASIFPYLIEQLSSSNYDKEKLRKIFFLIYAFTFIIVIPVFFITYYLDYFLGDEYEKVPGLVRILIFDCLLITLAAIRNKIIIIRNLTIFFAIVTFIGAATNILLNVFLLPIYGAVGAAYSTLIAHFISVIIVPLFHKGIRDIGYIMIETIFFKNVKLILSKQG